MIKLELLRVLSIMKKLSRETPRNPEKPRETPRNPEKMIYNGYIK